MEKTLNETALYTPYSKSPSPSPQDQSSMKCHLKLGYAIHDVFLTCSCRLPVHFILHSRLGHACAISTADAAAGSTVEAWGAATAGDTLAVSAAGAATIGLARTSRISPPNSLQGVVRLAWQSNCCCENECEDCFGRMHGCCGSRREVDLN